MLKESLPSNRTIEEQVDYLGRLMSFENEQILKRLVFSLYDALLEAEDALWEVDNCPTLEAAIEAVEKDLEEARAIIHTYEHKMRLIREALYL